IVATLVLWLVAGIAFGRYLAEFATAYVSYYAGLASAMIALVFLYWTASIFVYGGALNAAMLHPRSAATRAQPAPTHCHSNSKKRPPRRGAAPSPSRRRRAASTTTRRKRRAAEPPPRLRSQAAREAAARLPPDPRRVRSAGRSAHPEIRARHGAPAVGPC